MIYDTTKRFLFIVLFLGMSTGIFAADGDLDFSFDSNGVVLTDNGSDRDSIRDLVIQPDGKIIALGYSPVGSPLSARTAIVRYNTDGTVDTTFGTNGKVFIQSIEPANLALQTDGKIVISGRLPLPFVGEGFNGDFYVARLNSDGSFDPSFDADGELTLDLRGTNDSPGGLNIQPDGRIVVAGTTSVSIEKNDFAFVRFNSDGSLDTTFDGDGKAFVRILPGSESRYERLTGLEIQSDGKIVTAGSGLITTPPSGPVYSDVFFTLRHNSNGSPDPAFDSDGIAFTRIGTNDAQTRSLTIQPDGKILVVGASSTGVGNPLLRAALVRYNPDGSLDSSFGNGGITLSSLGPLAADVVVQSDNRIAISLGYSSIGRLQANGSPDLSFGGTGRSVSIFVPPNTAVVSYAMAIQANGKIVVGGYFRNDSVDDFLLARFEATSCTVNCPVPGSGKVADFDGDGKTDASVVRNGIWYIKPSSATNPGSFYGVQFGLATDRLTPADFDGDGRTDIAIWRPGATGPFGDFYIFESSTNSIRIVQFGQNTDDPRIVGDWDGDGKADLAVFRDGALAGTQSSFIYRPSAQPAIEFLRILWGIPGDEFVRGDFDGDNKMDPAVYRASTGIWYILNSSNGLVRNEYWGLASDKRVAGDYDGDGKADLAVYRNGFWAVLQSSNNQPRYEYWGLGSDRLVPGDYDGDGRMDFAIWRDGIYYILQNSNSQVGYQYFGLSGDIPVASAFIQ